MIAVVIAVTGLCCLRLPAHSSRELSLTAGLTTNIGPIALGLLGVALFFGGFVAFWAFFERLGQAHSISAKSIAMWIAVGMLAAAGGGLLTAVIGSRWGRQLSIAVAGVLTVAPLVLLGGTLQLWQYAIAAMLVPTANTFGIAYQMGFVAQNDVTGRLSSLTAAVVALASMACTITGGILLDADGYPALYWFIAALIGSSVLIFLHLTRR